MGRDAREIRVGQRGGVFEETRGVTGGRVVRQGGEGGEAGW